MMKKQSRVHKIVEERFEDLIKINLNGDWKKYCDDRDDCEISPTNVKEEIEKYKQKLIEYIKIIS